METIDLSNQLGAGGSAKADTAVPEWANTLEDRTTEYNKYEAVIDPALVDPEEETIDDINTDKPDKVDEDKWNPSELADLIVDTIGFIQEKSGEWAHWKTILTTDQKIDLREMVIEYGITKSNVSQPRKKVLTYYEKWLLQRRKEHDEYVELLPFTPDEDKRLKNAWRKFLKEKNAEISPGWALVATSASVLLPRMIPVITNMFDKEKKMMAPEADQIQEEEVKKSEGLIKDLKIDELTPEEMREALRKLQKQG